MTQSELIHHLADIIQRFKINHPLRVGIDGVDASGKTILADALADYLQLQEVNVIRSLIDGFHNPKAIRYQQGRNSPEGYYMDTTNYPVVIESILALNYKTLQASFFVGTHCRHDVKR